MKNYLLERFRTNSNIESNGCWLWSGPIAGKRGATYIRGTLKNAYIHRLIYQDLIYPLSEENDVHHLCGNELCFNPSHLTQVTKQHHQRLTTQSLRKEFCPNGHRMTPENSGKARQCLACVRARNWIRRRQTGEPVLPPSALRTHCPKGHPYDESNTRWDKYGHRVCRECSRKSSYAAWKKRRNPTACAPKDKTHCLRGHLYDEENTLITRKGHRQCRACRRQYKSDAKQRLQEIRSYSL